MALTEILYTPTESIEEEMAKINSKVAPLNSVRNDLIALGVTSPTLVDVRKLHGNEVSSITLKQLVLRDKTLSVAGLLLDPSTAMLDAELSHQIKTKLNALGGIDYSFYELVEILDVEDEPTGQYEVAVVADAGTRVTNGLVLRGSELAADIIEDVIDLAEAVNAIIAKLPAHSLTSPMNSPEHWLQHTVNFALGTRVWSADIYAIARMVDGRVQA